MTRLALTSVVIGAAVIAGRLPGIVWPERFREWAVKFPRSVWWGRGLMLVVAVWAGINVFRAASGDWAWARPLVVIGFPVGYWLVIQFAPHFLALRGAAAITLLVAKIMVDAADTSELPARLVVTTLAYVWVVLAIWMAVAPHHVRDLLNVVMANNKRCRAVCSVGVAIGAVLVALGLNVY
jgi:hypothetical protein